MFYNFVTYSYDKRMVKHCEVVPQLKVVAITCDRCKKRYEDSFETQEFLSWRDTCGYGNKTYGDMTIIAIDLCQYCVKQVLGEWIQANNFPMQLDERYLSKESPG